MVSPSSGRHRSLDDNCLLVTGYPTVVVGSRVSICPAADDSLIGVSAKNDNPVRHHPPIGECWFLNDDSSFNCQGFLATVSGRWCRNKLIKHSLFPAMSML